MPDLSVVIPVYNEIESLDVLYKELTDALGNLGIQYELVFVDDCSDDGSREKINAFPSSEQAKVRLIPLEGRSGQTFALKRGLLESKGDVVVTMDADLQNDPADIPKLIVKISPGPTT